MRSAALVIPGPLAGNYPERDERARARRDADLPQPGLLMRRRRQRFLDRVAQHAAALKQRDDTAFAAQARAVRAQVAAEGFRDAAVAEAFALVREATRRTLGKEQFDAQIIAARIMLEGKLAEMHTGEGKTLASVLAVATGALGGVPVHVLTANDYLVVRDEALLRPVYQLLGLSSGTVTQQMQQESRRAAYACDITYCTAKELAFDYLRDRMARRQVPSDLHERLYRMQVRDAGLVPPLLRGLCMAVIDEADSILIDEARTPLIIAQARVNAQKVRYAEQALRLAAELVPSVDCTFEVSGAQAYLTPDGSDRLAQMCASLDGLWQDWRHREEMLCLALAARHLYRRDEHYLVRDGKLLMIDQTTGRIAQGRVWSRGLQQLLEIKEGCTPTGEQETIAQITYQRLFPRYHHVCGMSGTLTEARAELRSVYGLSIEGVPLRRPSRRVHLPTRVFASSQQHWQAVVSRVAALRGQGCAVLIGTDSVADSERLAVMLAAARIPHRVLNARNHGEEAALIARAGESGSVTVTTNMAGRGTDIPLGPGVAERGGLHVICCQHNASARIDRQLHGRAGRQGEPGSVETLLSLEQGLLARGWPKFLKQALRRRGAPICGVLAGFLMWWPQMREEWRQRSERRLLLESDRRMQQRLSFSGRGE
jgi:preprotein translocase subunit SecA